MSVIPTTTVPTAFPATEVTEALATKVTGTSESPEAGPTSVVSVSWLASASGASACLVALAFFVAPPSHAQSRDVITDIRVHGNHTTPDTDILALSGLAPGDVATDERLERAGRALRDSGRFADVELRRRYASIADPSAILIVIVVDEHAAISGDDRPPGPAGRLRTAGLWLPILSHADGHGVTYGARVSVIDAIGGRSRLSVPMTWGGERRVGLEVERSFAGPVSVLRGSLSLHRRVNPHFDLSDLRQEVRVEAERTLASWLRGGTSARVARVGFGHGDDARHTAAGLHAIVDTRVDPSFPRNAIHARIGWERLVVPGRAFGAAAPEARVSDSRAGRWLTDIRGYVGVAGSAVVAVRGQLATSSAPLPSAEQVLLGGSDSLRGYRAGHRADDNAAALSAELRLPLSSPLGAVRFGAKVFVDSGTTWASGAPLRDQRFEHGIGGGVYFGAAALIADADIAWPEHGRPRVHVGLGVGF